MNTENIQQALTATIIRLLRPLIRILLRNGVSYGEFSDMAKWVYVDVADKEFAMPGKKQTVSRISTVTGLNRKEVSRVQSLEHPNDMEKEKRHNRAARVISGWIRDEDFLHSGEPRKLSFDGDSPNFSELVKAYSGDIPARAILDELSRVGAVSILDGNVIKLNTHGYIPSTGEQDKLHILGGDVADLVNTIDHNLQAKANEPFYQRKVYYDNLPEEALPRLKQMAAEQGQALLEEANKYLATQDRDMNPDNQGSGRKRAGIAVYYFEEDVQEGEKS
ncbi:MAG: hypothetical protein HUJ30_00170 [Gammaproteobacteria bacterium]|nr:hypothetical protein [Gammaproteobacteria bacterium]